MLDVGDVKLLFDLMSNRSNLEATMYTRTIGPKIFVCTVSFTWSDDKDATMKKSERVFGEARTPFPCPSFSQGIIVAQHDLGKHVIFRGRHRAHS